MSVGKVKRREDSILEMEHNFLLLDIISSLFCCQTNIIDLLLVCVISYVEVQRPSGYWVLYGVSEFDFQCLAAHKFCWTIIPQEKSEPRFEKKLRDDFSTPLLQCLELKAYSFLCPVVKKTLDSRASLLTSRR